MFKKILLISALAFTAGCGNAKMVKRTYDPISGKLVAEDYIKVNRLGSGKLTDVSTNLVKGSTKIGSREGDIGGLGQAINALIERIPTPIP